MATLPPDVIDKARSLLPVLGPKGFGVSTDTFARALAGLPVQRGSVSLINDAIARAGVARGTEGRK